MTELFINLKRFEVSRSKGGVCPYEDPKFWIEEVVGKSVQLGIGAADGVHVVYLLPESLIIPAQEKLSGYPKEVGKNIEIGCQSVFRHNIQAGANFGAFTSNFPAASAFQIGCRWSIIGHSEERRDKQEIIAAFEPECLEDRGLKERCAAAVDGLVNQEALAALEQGMNVLLCIGETSGERGGGSFDEQKKRISDILEGQLKRGLAHTGSYSSKRRIIIGYEPIWAIGPGKTPPDSSYISFVSSFIKDKVKQMFDYEIPVIYGGGLNENNASGISSISTIDGGLVALTRFSGEIGFYVEDLKIIIDILKTRRKDNETGF